jgi:integrase
MLTWAVEMEILDVHPLFRFKMLKEQQKMFTPLTPEEVDLIIKAQPNHPMMALVAVMAETGLRRAEGISLMWSQVDLVNRRLVTGVTKNYRGRTIPLSTRALEWLMSMPRQDGIPEVFIRHKRCNGNKVAMVDPTATFFRAAKKVGLRGIGWHDLRRYRATQWHKMGLEVREIQYLLGHASIETTRRYLGIDRGLLERVQAAQNKELAQSERKDGIFGRTVDGQGQNREIGEAVSY